jgi:hypothetical protein
MTKRLARGAAGAIAIAGIFALGGACNTIDKALEANNPERIDINELNDPKLVNTLVASAIGEFQNVYDDPFIWQGSMFTDEQITGINWEQTARLSQRIVRFDEGPADGMFSDLQKPRWMADTAASLLRNLLDDPQSDARLATVLAYGGYSYIMLAETLCGATIELSDRIFSSDELMGFAIDRFEDALTIAQAAGDADLLNLAHTGIARAALWRGDDALVMQHAGAVSQDFTWWVEYKNATPREQNTLWTRVTGQNHALGVHPHFLNGTFGENDITDQPDPRIQHTPDWSFGHNRLTLLYKPYQSLPYSGYNGETIADGGDPILYEADTDIKLGSYIEAMHHYYEAAGPGGTGPMGTTLDFVNARRAFGHQSPVNLSGDALMAELRDQRSRDLYLGGFRLGDLRRWEKEGVGNFFPNGAHPTTEWGQYGDAECYPVPSTEYESNPNISR